MPFVKFLSLPLLAALLAGLAAAPVSADDDHEAARRLREAGAILPLEQVLERLRAVHPAARVIETELERERGRYLYEIKLVDAEGRVCKLKYDARDGSLIEGKCKRR